MKLKKNKKILLLISIIFLAIFIYFMYPKEETVNYITTSVRNGNIENIVLATGSINAAKQVEVGAQVSGQIKVIHVQLGQKIKKNDLIAEIDSVPQENALKEAKAALENYKAQLKAKKVSYEKASLNYTRQFKMYKQDATSQENLEDAKVNLAIAEADVSQLKTQIDQATISLDTAKVNLGYTKIVSPIDGIIVSLPVEEGQTVNSNQSTPTIVKIAQLDKVIIKAEISEGDIANVKQGMPVYFTVLGNTQKVYHSNLKSIDPGPKSLSDSTSNTSSSTTSSTDTAIYYYGSFEVPNPDNDLRIAMTAQVSIVLNESKNTLIIPYMSLKTDNDKTYVTLLDKNNNPVEKEVQIGINNNVEVEVLSGLTTTDKVVVSQAKDSEKQEVSRAPRRM